MCLNDARGSPASAFHAVCPLIEQATIWISCGGKGNPPAGEPESCLCWRNERNIRLSGGREEDCSILLTFGRLWILVCVGVWRSREQRTPSRRDLKLRTVASKVSPVGGPGGLKTHAHSEQPQPRKRGWSIHTSSRFIRRIVQHRELTTTCCLPRFSQRHGLRLALRTIMRTPTSSFARCIRCLARSNSLLASFNPIECSSLVSVLMFAVNFS